MDKKVAPVAFPPWAPLLQASSYKSTPQPRKGMASLGQAGLASVVYLGTVIVTVDLFQTIVHKLADF